MKQLSGSYPSKAGQLVSEASLSSLPNDTLHHIMRFLDPSSVSSFVQTSRGAHKCVGPALRAVDKKVCDSWLEKMIASNRNKKLQLLAPGSWAELVKDNGSWLFLTGFGCMIVMTMFVMDERLRYHPFILAIVGIMLASQAVLLVPLLTQYFRVRACDERLQNLESVKRSL